MFTSVRLIRSIFAWSLLLTTSSYAQIQSGQKPDISAELVVGGFDQSGSSDAWLGVRVKLGPGWKTYWRSPGDAGLPPEFDWSGSSNLKTAELAWPAPHRMTILGLETIGYTGEVVFPVKLHVADPTLSTTINLKLAVYACSTICVRADRELVATLQPGQRDPMGRAIVDAWRDKVPTSAAASLRIESVRLLPNSSALEIAAVSTIPFENPDAFVESEPPVYGTKPVVELVGSTGAMLTVTFPGEKADALAGRSFRVTVIDGARAAEATSGVAAATRPIAGAERPNLAAQAQPIWSVLLIALMGGFILNLMPCVFPVLSLKLLAFVNGSSADRGHVRAGFAASAAGIVGSFLVLASALIAFKAGGATIGWGIQFQQPIFLSAMAIVLTLFAANLLGLFEFILPSALANRLGAVATGPSVASHFASGFVATLLATPCSAPFVGTAVGFALARGPLEIYQVFAALGLGMASPYLLVSLFPGLALLLPRPGRWMLLVKRLMAAALLGTAVWLLTIVSATASPMVAAALGAVLLLIVMLLSLRSTERPRAVIAGSVFILAAAATIMWVSPSSTLKPGIDVISWRPFVRDDVSALVQQGRTVFVDVTADWCVTCKVNKALVIDSRAVEQRLSADVIPVKADWTKPDDRIAAFLKDFGRYGLPFNVVFGPATPNGIVLPELLSKEALLAAFDRAASRQQSSFDK